MSLTKPIDAIAQSLSLTDATALPSDVLVFEFGCRVDRSSLPALDEQIYAARRLYNEIIGAMRSIYEAMNAWVIEQAPDDVRRYVAQVSAASNDFAAARATNDEAAMKTIAEYRRGLWRLLSPALKAIRREHRAEISLRFLSQIGIRKECITYQLRCAAVDKGLGWATANDVLDRALIAWKMSMVRGRPPQFSIGEEKQQDTLTLQFTKAGGVDVERILRGLHSELSLTCATPAKPRAYGEFKFRLGAASAGTYATGTWQYHRALPPGGYATSARLVRRKAADRFKWFVQVVARRPAELPASPADRLPLACVHLGWAQDSTGRRVAAIADAADSGAARIVGLAPDIESDFVRAAELDSQRSLARDKVMPQVKDALRDIKCDDDEKLAAEIATLLRLPEQHIAASRLYRLQRWLRSQDRQIAALDTFVRDDRIAWQGAVGIARRARRRRLEQYRAEAFRLATSYRAVAIEKLDLQSAAKKVDEVTGERSEFAAKARSGRVVASVGEFASAIRAACATHGTAVFDVNVPSVSTCAHCGGSHVITVERDWRLLRCEDCGVETDRKQHGAARAWQLLSVNIEAAAQAAILNAVESKLAATATKASRLERMATARKAAREVRTLSDETAA